MRGSFAALRMTTRNEQLQKQLQKQLQGQRWKQILCLRRRMTMLGQCGDGPGAVGLCPIPTHDDEAVMNGAPGNL